MDTRTEPHPADGNWHRKGFTLIEVMLAVLIIVVGLVGVIAMQIVAVQANAAARDVTEATNVGEHFVNLLRQDASRWTVGGDLTRTEFLAALDSTPDTWMTANGEPVNVLGVPKSGLPPKGAGRAKFCVAYKLHWAIDQAVISGFVRVFWSKVGGSTLTDGCGGSGGIGLDALDVRSKAVGISMVTLPLTVRRTDVD